MHLFDAERRFVGGNAIVAGGIPLAIGLALADQMQGRQRVTACFFGDGAFADTLPKTRSGKILRRLLRARELGLPEGDLSTLETGR